MPNTRRKVSDHKNKLANYRRIRDTVLDAATEADAAVVDGVHDRITLRHLGFDKPIYTHSKYSYVELADRIAKKHQTVIVLTDFDAEGTLANELITVRLEERKVRVCKTCRDTIAKSLKELDITTVEGIYQLII